MKRVIWSSLFFLVILQNSVHAKIGHLHFRLAKKQWIYSTNIETQDYSFILRSDSAETSIGSEESFIRNYHLIEYGIGKSFSFGLGSEYLFSGEGKSSVDKVTTVNSTNRGLGNVDLVFNLWQGNSLNALVKTSLSLGNKINSSKGINGELIAGNNKRGGHKIDGTIFYLDNYFNSVEIRYLIGVEYGLSRQEENSAVKASESTIDIYDVQMDYLVGIDSQWRMAKQFGFGASLLFKVVGDQNYTQSDSSGVKISTITKQSYNSKILDVNMQALLDYDLQIKWGMKYGMHDNSNILISGSNLGMKIQDATSLLYYFRIGLIL